VARYKFCHGLVSFVVSIFQVLVIPPVIDLCVRLQRNFNDFRGGTRALAQMTLEELYVVLTHLGRELLAQVA
jgi:hypothetical protein